MRELILELEEIRNQLMDYPISAKGKTHKELSEALTKTIEGIREFYQDVNIPDVLAPEDLPDDEDL